MRSVPMVTSDPHFLTGRQVLVQTLRGFAPVRPYRIPLSEAVLMLPFQRFPLLDEVWADEDTPVATEVTRG